MRARFILASLLLGACAPGNPGQGGEFSATAPAPNEPEVGWKGTLQGSAPAGRPAASGHTETTTDEAPVGPPPETVAPIRVGTPPVTPPVEPPVELPERAPKQCRGKQAESGSCWDEWLTSDVGLARCGVREDHTLWCWGRGWSAMTPTWQEARYPQQLGDDADWTSISMGPYTGCGLRGGGSLWCFGHFYTGDAYKLDLEPQPIDGGAEEWANISTGTSAVCGVKHDGTLWCHGYVASLLAGSTEKVVTEPIQVGTDSDWTKVVNSGTSACAGKQDGSLHCFGANYSGQLGDGTNENRPLPVPVAAAGPWRDFTIANDTCAIHDDGTLWCWGYRFGAEPVLVDDRADWEELGGHEDLVCGTRAGGRLYCLGAEMRDGVSVFVMMPIDEGGGYSEVSAGCANYEDGSLRCWGHAPLGDGSGNIVDHPVPAGDIDDWQEIHTDGRLAGIREGGVLVAGGSPEDGTSGWKKLASGSPVAGIKDDGSLWWWGSPYSEFDLTLWKYPMVQISPDKDWLDIAASTFWCGIRGASLEAGGTL
ncbi:MAG TPA: hypothetical protein VM686_39880, partial [Polyangiaceae bacterium]|nr:hypothetical protein [Polyangiaceae bacterium]